MNTVLAVLAVLVAGLAMSTATAWAQAGGAQAGDATKGERVFALQCKACHTLERGGSSVTGPNLYGLMARKSGTAPGYGFSEAMRRFAIEWNDQTLANYLRDPKGDMPGTKMVFAGIKRPDQLADVVAYLKQATQ
jgi:cytochrome c